MPPITGSFGALTARGFGLFSAPATVLDPYFPYVTMLLHGDGTNGAQNNTFLDSSTNNFSITRNGNTTQGSFSPYGANWSNYFDGSSYITTPSNAAFGTGTGNFTVEAWVFITQLRSSNGENNIIGGGATNSWLLGFFGSSVYLASTNSGYTVQISYTLPLNQWVHIAAVRNGNTATIYVNGTSIGSGSYTTNCPTGYGVVGGDGANGTARCMYGYISNARFNNTALYSSNFTPSTTPLTAVSGTQLLTCQSNRFIDNSTNNFAITVTGTPSVQRFSPFSPTAAYSTSTIGGSGYFDGSGDYLTVANNAALNLSTGDFTIECWAFPITGISDVDGIIGKRNQGAFNSGDWRIAYRSASTAFGIATGSNNTDRLTPAITLNAWNHIAFVRSSGTLSCYANGTRGDNLTWTENLDNAEALLIGLNTAGYDFPGYISNVRIIKGTAVYSGSTYTVPIAPLTAIANTSLLINFTNGGIFDNAMMNNLETVGNAQISTSVFKYGTGSLAFDGTGDGLALPANVNLAIGSGNFTIEMWINGSVSNNNTTKGGSFARAFTLGTAQGTGNIEVYFNDSNNCIISISAGTNIQFASSSILSSAWVHFAIVRSGTTLTAYANGTSVGSTTNSTNLNLAATTQSWIGAISSSAGTFNGYIDDFRITKGYARYTANFTPPTQAFQNN